MIPDFQHITYKEKKDTDSQQKKKKKKLIQIVNNQGKKVRGYNPALSTQERLQDPISKMRSKETNPHSILGTTSPQMQHIQQPNYNNQEFIWIPACTVLSSTSPTLQHSDYPSVKWIDRLILLCFFNHTGIWLFKCWRNSKIIFEEIKGYSKLLGALLYLML